MDNILEMKWKFEKDDGASNNPKLKNHQCNENYLSFGFISNNEILACPICRVFSEILANEAMFSVN